jgi:hypothetical protein
VVERERLVVDSWVAARYLGGRNNGIINSIATDITTMAAVKVAISMQKSLFERAERAARRMSVSRSRLLSLALEDFLTKHDAAELTRRINEACEASPPDEEDRAFFRLAASSVAKWGKDEKW